MQAVLRALRAHLVIVSICLFGVGRGIAAAADGPTDAEVVAAQRAFAAEVAGEGGPAEAEVLKTLAGAKLQQSILDAIARPAEATKPWSAYAPIFLTDKRIDDGVEFYRANRELLLGRDRGHTRGLDQRRKTAANAKFKASMTTAIVDP
jgi:membrane-bound lytic murein transglycosylase B